MSSAAMPPRHFFSFFTDIAPIRTITPAIHFDTENNDNVTTCSHVLCHNQAISSDFLNIPGNLLNILVFQHIFLLECVQSHYYF